MNTFVFVLIFMAYFLPAFAADDAPFPFVQSTNVAASQNGYDRRAAWQEWLRALDKIEPYCKDLDGDDRRDCLAVIEYVRVASVLAEPSPMLWDPNKTLLYKLAPMPDNGFYPFFAIPIVEQDAAAGTIWKLIVEDRSRVAVTFGDGSEAESDHVTPVVTFRSEAELGNLWRGLTLFHEGHHAAMIAYGLTEGFTSEEDREAFVEARAYLLEFRLLEQIGGKVYREIISAEAKRIVGTYRATRKFTLAPLPIPTVAALRRIFGPARSSAEARLRGGSFFLHTAEQAFQLVCLKKNREYYGLLHTLFRNYLKQEREGEGLEQVTLR